MSQLSLQWEEFNAEGMRIEITYGATLQDKSEKLTYTAVKWSDVFGNWWLETEDQTLVALRALYRL